MNELPGWLIVVFLGLLVFAAACRAAYDFGVSREHRKNVMRETEFRGYSSIALTQEDVDRILQRLAMEFHRACTAEISFLNTLPHGERDEHALETNCTSRLQERADAVKTTKDVFWKTLYWFNYLGYSVKPKSGDYIQK